MVMWMIADVDFDFLVKYFLVAGFVPFNVSLMSSNDEHDGEDEKTKLPSSVLKPSN